MKSRIRTYIIDLVERAVKAGVFAAATLAGGIQVTGGAFTLSDYEHIGGVAAGAAVLSLLTNLAAGLRTGTASLSRSVAASAVSQAPGAHAADSVPSAATTAPSDLVVKTS